MDKSSKLIIWIIAALIVGGLVGYFLKTGKSETVSLGQMTLKTDMRELWADHVLWTRDYIIATVAGSESADAAAARLLKNQEDIGNAIAPYYGQEAGQQLTALLKEHILISVDLLDAAKAGNDTEYQAADQRWHDNADEIATFLSQANPDNWPKPTTLSMLNEHLSLTTQEAVVRLEGNWEEDVAMFDRVFDQAMMMADGLSNGIIKQFPEKF